MVDIEDYELEDIASRSDYCHYKCPKCKNELLIENNELIKQLKNVPQEFENPT